MFIGEFHHNIDDKGRLIIPSKFRCELGEKFIITRGLDKCLFIYSMNERNFSRFFLSGATECEFDKQGRILITSPLVHYANLVQKCVIIGVNERIEVWDEEEFNKFLNDNEEQFSEIAENLFTQE